ncbi:MAG: Transglycosylase-associated protein [Candidatus Saccharibacteria bacterium]|nr:Transglycosylase-associated protein [Candidatus Saccharibacteria bacterium]
MGMNILLWIIFGAIVGWLASIIMRTNEEMGAMANIIVGIIGAFIGGIVARMLGGQGVDGFNLGSLIVAILGACLLLFFIRLVSRGRGSAVHH